MKYYIKHYKITVLFLWINTLSFKSNSKAFESTIFSTFLPAFIGANPYKQAHERGVKIIGATAHYVTNDLDEGPIIFQDVVRVDHSYSWEDMRNAGRNVEKIVLSNAFEMLLHDRVFVHGNKTVIL